MSVWEPEKDINTWYSPGQVRKFRSEHIVWLLEHLLLLKEGYYPPDPASAISPGGRQFRAGASYETARQIYTELITRLERCGLDGLLLVARDSSGLDDREIGDFLRQPCGKIHKRINDALRYISGEGRKWMKRGKYEPTTYHEFRHHIAKKTPDT